MRAAVLATSLVLGLGGLGPDACARDARPRAGVTQAATTQDTRTPARPDSVPRPAAARAAAARAAAAGDAPPHMRNPRPPFRYPGALYRARAEGDVTLRLWVDSSGRVAPESTRVAASSGARLLDSAAVAGSARLEFTPARRGGRPAGAALRFPVHFRHPAASAPPTASAARRR